MDWFKLAYTAFGGLGLFFFGFRMMSENLQVVSGALMHKVVNALTESRGMAVLVGLIVTVIIQSSSVTTVMMVGFVNAGLMSLAQAVGLILGANVGTTVTGWIVAWTWSVGDYSMFFLGLGIFPVIFAQNEKVSSIGKVIFALGLVFLGVRTMSLAFQPLGSHGDFLKVLSFLEASGQVRLFAAVGVGCLLTFIVQSSSVMLGITVALASSGAISFQMAVALVLGENIGTTLTALFAAKRANVAARRAVWAHFILNAFGVVVVSSVFYSCIDLVDRFVMGDVKFSTATGERPFVALHIAAIHTFFNVGQTLIFLPFIGVVIKVVRFLVPDQDDKEPQRLEFFGTAMTLSPSLAIEQARQEASKMAAMVQTLLSMTVESLSKRRYDGFLEKKILKYEGITDNIQKEVMGFLGSVMSARMTREQVRVAQSTMRMADELESIADHCQAIVLSYKELCESSAERPEKPLEELKELLEKVIEQYDMVFDQIARGLYFDFSTYKQIVATTEGTVQRLTEENLAAVVSQKMNPKVGTLLGGVIFKLQDIGGHTTNIIDAYFGGKEKRMEALSER